MADKTAAKSGMHYVKCRFQKNCAQSRNDHAILPEVAVQERAKKNESCSLGQRWSHQVLSPHL